MIVTSQKPITLVNTCGAIYDEQLLIEAMLWFTTEPMVATKKVFMYGKYPAVAIHRHKLHIHRLIMAYLNNGLPRSTYVNHKDENKLNSSVDNLELLDASTHQRLTNLGRKQTKEWVAKRLANSWKTRKAIYENGDLLK